MDCEVLGWPPDGPTLDLDWREFSYAGKFVMTNTGKAVARRNGEIVGAVAFNADRTDPDTGWLRYLTVRSDLRGTGVGTKLASFTAGRLLEADFDRVRIAVNNPFAYEALYKAGFAFTGEETGVAELVLERPKPPRALPYRDGLERFANRELSEREVAFLDEKFESGPPSREGH